MYILTFFKDRADFHRIAATPDKTGSVLPQGDWESWFAQPVFPEIAGPDLSKIQAGIARDGYFLYQLHSTRH